MYFFEKNEIKHAYKGIQIMTVLEITSREVCL